MTSHLTGSLHWFERASYQMMHELQHHAVTRVQLNPLEPLLFLGTHRHIITHGRGTNKANILSASMPGIEPVEQVPIERGGDVTYHGPGQLVGYPILHLDLLPTPRDLHLYLRNLEEVLILAVQSYGVDAGRRAGLTGVWVGPNLERKMASIGIAVKRWVTYHGFAINLNTDLRYFQLLNPCGLDSQVITSLGKELDQEVDELDFSMRLLAAIKIVFAIDFKVPQPQTAPRPAAWRQS